MVVILFFIFLSLVGNSWVIFIIARRRRLQTTSNWFILSLAAADLGVTCVLAPYTICDVILDTCKEEFEVVKIFAFFFVKVSAIGLIAMVAERYVAIVHSLKYVRVFTTTRRTFIIIGTCWGFPFLFNVLRRAMNFADGRHSVKTRIIEVIHIFLFVVVPTVLLLTAHFHILLIARKLSLQMRALMKQVRFNMTANSLKTKEIRNVGLKASTVRLVSVLVAIFTACYGVRFYFLFCKTFKICSVSEPIRVMNKLLLLANSTLNPLMYAFLKEDIKRETNAFLPRKRHLKTRPFQVHSE